MGKGKVTVGPYQAVDREGVRVLDQREDGVLARAQEDRRHVVVLVPTTRYVITMQDDCENPTVSSGELTCFSPLCVSGQ